MDAGGRGVELLDKVVDVAPLLDDGLAEGTVFIEFAAISLTLLRGWSQVLPEERVIDVS